jgi:hypothetical protein
MAIISPKKLAALIKKNAEKAAKTRAQVRRQYDHTLSPEPQDDDSERRAFFAEMKKREF